MASDICCFGFVGHLTVGISGIWDLFYSKYHYDWIKQLFLPEYNNIDMFFLVVLFRIKHVMQWKYLMNWWSLKSVLWLPMWKLWLSSVFRCVTSWMFYSSELNSWHWSCKFFAKGWMEIVHAWLQYFAQMTVLKFQCISLAPISFLFSIPCVEFVVVLFLSLIWFRSPLLLGMVMHIW